MTTTIEWTGRRLADGTRLSGYTFNPWWGCLKVSEECPNCYAAAIAQRAGFALWGPAATTPRRLFGEHHWHAPLLWNQQAARQGHRFSVFCASMADVFEQHPQVEDARARLWCLIAKTPHLNWLLLTKRPEHILTLAPWTQIPWPDNVWIGVSAGNQRRANER